MIKNNRLLKIIIITFIIICMVSISGIANADFPEKITGTSSSQSETAVNIAQIILGGFQVVGYFLAVIILVWMGIKYITSSPDGRAEIKKQSLTYFIGVVLLFSAGTIVGWLKDSV